MSAQPPEHFDKLQQDGELELARVFVKHRTQLRNMIAFRIDHRLRGRVDASDILQNTFLKAKDELPSYLRKPKYSVPVWLRILNKRTLAEVHRRELAKRRMPCRRQDDSHTPTEEICATDPSPSQTFARKEAIHRIGDVLNSLSDTDQGILISYHMEQRPIQDVAEELGISVPTAMKRYVRAIRRLTERAKQQLDLSSRAGA